MIKKAVVLRHLENFFVIFSIIFFSGAFFYPIRRAMGFTSTEADGDPVARLIYFTIYCMTFLLLWKHLRFIFVAFLREKWLVLLLALVVVSIAWSDFPGLTFRRSIAILGTTGFGIYLITRFSLSEQLRLLFVAISIILVASLLTVLFLPEHGVMSGIHAGAWSGVMAHKNTLGRIATMGGITSILFAVQEPRERKLFWGMAIVSIIVLYFSQSRTSWLVFMGLVILLPCYKTLYWNHKIAGVIHSGLLLLSLVFGLIVLLNLGSILESMGKDTTLSGRLNFWPPIVKMIAQKPLLGYGYSGFWAGEGSGAEQLRQSISWEDIPHSHNGVLDLGLDLGFIGISLFCMGFLLASMKALKLLIKHYGLEQLWCVTYLIYFFLFNLTEGIILRTNNLYWILYVVTTMWLGQRVRIKLLSLSNHI